MRKIIGTEAKTDMPAQQAPTLNDPKTTLALINANAIVGIVPTDTNGDKRIDIMAGDKVGIA